MPDVELNGTAYTYSDTGSGEPIVHICGDEGQFCPETDDTIFSYFFSFD